MNEQNSRDIQELVNMFSDCEEPEEPTTGDIGSDIDWATNRILDPTEFNFTPQDGPHRDAVNTPNMHSVNEKKKTLTLLCEPQIGGSKLADTSYLKSYNGQRPQDYVKDLNTNFFVDFSNPYVWVSADIDLSNASGSEDAWFAFWLMGPNTWNHETNEPWVKDGNIPYMCSYDCKPETGMEVDIMEYAPFFEGTRDNGFNVACYTGTDKQEKRLRPTHNHYGYFENINNHIKKDIDISTGFHRYTMIKTPESCHFYVDDQEYWSYTDKNFIPTGRNMGVRLSWEVQRGLWRGRKDPSIPNFKEIGKTLSVDVKNINIKYGDELL